MPPQCSGSDILFIWGRGCFLESAYYRPQRGGTRVLNGKDPRTPNLLDTINRTILEPGYVLMVLARQLRYASLWAQDQRAAASLLLAPADAEAPATDIRPQRAAVHS
jgi:hypothetical protein